MIPGTRRSILLGTALVLGEPLTARAASSLPSRGYTCPPCGCVMSGRLFSSPGTCPVCGMALIPMEGLPGEPAADFPPVQLEMRVPFAPTAVPSAGQAFLIYELHLRNFGNRPVSLGRLEILDADADTTVASFEGVSLEALISPVGQGALTIGDGPDSPFKAIYFDEEGGNHALPPGVKREVYAWLDRQLGHRPA